MDQKIRIHARINKTYPDATGEDIVAAGKARVKCQARIEKGSPQYVAIGFDKNGRALQMVAAYDPAKNEALIFHAMEAASGVKRELGFC